MVPLLKIGRGLTRINADKKKSSALVGVTVADVRHSHQRPTFFI
jgi:hypothetical protein